MRGLQHNYTWMNEWMPKEKAYRNQMQSQASILFLPPVQTHTQEIKHVKHNVEILSLQKKQLFNN